MQHFESIIVDSVWTATDEYDKKTGLGGQNKALKIQFALVDSQMSGEQTRILSRNVDFSWNSNYK